MFVNKERWQYILSSRSYYQECLVLIGRVVLLYQNTYINKYAIRKCRGLLNISTRVWVLHIPNFGQNVLLHVFGPFCKILCKMKNKMMQKAHNFGLCPNAGWQSSTLENDKNKFSDILYADVQISMSHAMLFSRKKKGKCIYT